MTQEQKLQLIKTLYSLLKAHGIQIAQAARRLGVSPSEVSGWRGDFRDIPNRHVPRIKKMINFLEEKTPIPPPDHFAGLQLPEIKR